jgi:hypothetical protein
VQRHSPELHYRAVPRWSNGSRLHDAFVPLDHSFLVGSFVPRVCITQAFHVHTYIRKNPDTSNTYTLQRTCTRYDIWQCIGQDSVFRTCLPHAVVIIYASRQKPAVFGKVPDTEFCVKCRFKRVEGNTNPDLDIPEPFALEAKYFVESRLLNRDVQVEFSSRPPVHVKNKIP